MRLAASQMDLETITLSDISQTRQPSYDITCIWDPKKMVQMKFFIKQKQIHNTEKNVWLPKGKGGEG